VTNVDPVSQGGGTVRFPLGVPLGVRLGVRFADLFAYARRPASTRHPRSLEAHFAIERSPHT